MSTETLAGGRITLHCGDCLSVMAAMEPESVDAIVTDPPYHLQSIVSRFAKSESARSSSGPHQRTANGFMGKAWDGGDVAFRIETWAAALRVLKPGGWIVAFSSSRTFGRMSVALEDAGAITHPMLGWIFGQGFPKAHDAAKAIDRELGTRGEIEPTGAPVRRIRPGADQHADGTWEKLPDRTYQPGTYRPASPEAERWQGYAYGGQALKPALEPIYMGQKPFSERNGAANILKHNVGALNIDGCRIPVEDDAYARNAAGDRGHDQNRSRAMGFAMTAGRASDIGRWPANLAHDGSPEVIASFPDAPGAQAPVTGAEPTAHGFSGVVYGYGGTAKRALSEPRPDAGGSAARYFYAAKAGADDRLGSSHPTVKPLDLMRWLVRMVLPPGGGTILDPFAGTGTTGAAAFIEGARAILIEREAEYQADIRRRMEALLAGPDERRRIAARPHQEAASGLPLFGGGAE